MRSPFQLTEDKMLRLGTVLVGLTVLFTVAVLFFCHEQDRELAAHGVNIDLYLLREITNEWSAKNDL